MGEIHTSFGAVRGALRGMHGVLGSPGAEEEERRQAEAIARQEAALTDAMSRIEVRGSRETARLWTRGDGRLSLTGRGQHGGVRAARVENKREWDRGNTQATCFADIAV